jgi:protein-disulfide isomerase
MESNPEAFMNAFERAAQRASVIRAERMEREEAERRAAELRTPLTPVLDPARVYEGEPGAPVTIVEYSDFECPYCRRGVATLDEVLDRYAGRVRLLYKHNPNSAAHPHAPLAARYYEAIALQDAARARAFRHALFDGQEELSLRGEAFLREQAVAVGADAGRLRQDLSAAVVAERIAADSAEADAFGFTGTPAYVINGVSIRGAYPLEEFVELIELHLAREVE